MHIRLNITPTQKPSSGSGAAWACRDWWSDGGNSHYLTDVVHSGDYYPFGSELPGRGLPGTKYRYGFNGMEKDDEVRGDGNSYTTMFRQYDPRIGRWLSIDPVTHHWQSPYCAFDNNPIFYADPSGADGEPKSTDIKAEEDEYQDEKGNRVEFDLEGVEITTKEKYTTSYSITLDYEVIEPKHSWIPYNYPEVNVLNTGVVTDYNAQQSDERQVSVTIYVPVVYPHNLDNPSYDVYTYTGTSLDGINDPSNWLRQIDLADAFFDGFKTGVVVALSNEVLMELQIAIATSRMMQSLVPKEARNVVSYAKKRNGAVQPGYSGGNLYRNDGRSRSTVLPKKTGSGRNITYKEYKITPNGTSRGKARVVIGSDGRSWYTSDHYKTFIQIL